MVIDTSKIGDRVYSKDEKVYNKDEVIQILYEKTVPVIEKEYDRVLDSSKYVRLARDYHYTNYRFLRYQDLSDWGLLSSFSPYQRHFISSSGAVLAIFNSLNKKPVSIVFRSLDKKEFMDYSYIYSVYGYDMMDSNFKYGDYLIVTEGLYDADTIRQIYPNVVATQTSNITLLQKDILLSMTDKFILGFDADDAGENGFKKALQRLGTDIKKLPIYGSDKDLGVMEEVKNNSFEFKLRREFYIKALEECREGEGFLI